MSREQFEVWAKKEKLGIAYGDCGYVFSSTKMAWRAWQTMEAKCAALAAENAALKDYLAPIGLKIEGAPATDVFLAEVRAQGVEMFAQALRGEVEITKACTFKPVQQFEEFAARADECAAKLRQDANTAELVAAGIITKVGE